MFMNESPLYGTQVLHFRKEWYLCLYVGVHCSTSIFKSEREFEEQQKMQHNLNVKGFCHLAALNCTHGR